MSIVARWILPRLRCVPGAVTPKPLVNYSGPPTHPALQTHPVGLPRVDRVRDKRRIDSTERVADLFSESCAKNRGSLRRVDPHRVGIWIF